MKRVVDVLGSAVGLLLLGPLFVLVGVAVKLDSPGPVFFLQQRVGWRGRAFRILKFRTMVVNAAALGLAVTAAGDRRVTRVGKFLRRTKLDELPQLWNVLRGEMSFVGPRPEVPKYVELYTPEQRRVLELKPGITDLASLEFIDEEAILGAVPNPEEVYVQQCVPRKIALNLTYAETASFQRDLTIVFRTLAKMLNRAGQPTKRDADISKISPVG